MNQTLNVMTLLGRHVLTRRLLPEILWYHGILDQFYLHIRLRQRLHGTGSVWNRYEIGTDKPCIYTGPGGSGTDRICYLVPNESTYESDPMWNRTVPV